MSLLDKAAIFDIAEQGFKMAEVPVPEWGAGVSVRVRELSEPEFRQVGGEMGGKEGTAAVTRAMDYVYDVAVWCVVDEEGQPVFEKKDRAELRKRAKTATFYQGLAVISNAVFELSGLTSDDEEEEDEEKN